MLVLSAVWLWAACLPHRPRHVRGRAAPTTPTGQPPRGPCMERERVPPVAAGQGWLAGAGGQLGGPPGEAGDYGVLVETRG